MHAIFDEDIKYDLEQSNNPITTGQRSGIVNSFPNKVQLKSSSLHGRERYECRAI
jgi:hypothetical protein